MKGQERSEKLLATVTLTIYQDGHVDLGGLCPGDFNCRAEFLRVFNKLLAACGAILHKPDVVFPWWSVITKGFFNGTAPVLHFRQGDPAIPELVEVTEAPEAGGRMVITELGVGCRRGKRAVRCP